MTRLPVATRNVKLHMTQIKKRAKWPHRASARHEMIDSLETRRLLTTYTGTPGNDTIEVFVVAPKVHVIINGVTQTSTNGSIIVDAGDGDDVIYLHNLNNFPNGLFQQTYNLGPGSDLITTYNPQTSQSSLGLIMYDLTVYGDAADTLAIDDVDGTIPRDDSFFYDETTGLYDYDFAQFAGFPTISVNATLGNVTLDGNADGAYTTLGQKPAAMHFTENAGGGNDTINIGAYDLAGNGWTSNTTTLTGGAGNDEIDLADAVGANSLNGMNLASSTVSKNGSSLSYFTFESMGLSAAPSETINVTGPNVSDLLIGADNGAQPSYHSTINLLTTPASTSIVGSKCTVNVGNGDLANIGAAVSITLGSTSQDVVNINDQNAVGDGTYVVSATQITRDHAGLTTLSYSGVKNLALNAGSGNDLVSVTGVAAGVNMSIHGDNGNDTLAGGNGSFAALLSPISFYGDAGIDSMQFSNVFDLAFTSATLSSALFAAAGETHFFSTCESILIAFGAGGSSLDILALAIPTTVAGGSGNDSLTIGDGDFGSSLLTNVTFNGNSGIDTMLADGQSSNGSDNYKFLGGQLRVGPDFNFKTISYTGLEAATLQSGSGSDTISVASTPFPLLIVSGMGNDVISASSSPGVTVQTDGESASPAVGDRLTVNASATAKMQGVDRIGSVTTVVGGKLQIFAGAILINTHDLTHEGVIDVAGGAMIVNNAATLLTTYSAWLQGGYNGGTWNGTSGGTLPGAINSSLAALTPSQTAIGFAPASAIFGSFPSTFLGQSVTATDMLVRYTTVGDANLDGVTNALDFNALATNFGAKKGDWYQGDFNYDKKIDTLDFNMLATQFNASIKPPKAAATNLLRAMVLAPANLFDIAAIAAQSKPDVFLDSVVSGNS